MGYYNTTNETGQQLSLFKKLVTSQDEAVHYVFKESNEPLGPSRVYNKLCFYGFITEATPITSIRRSISNLTKQQILTKTDVKEPGAFGRPEYCWELKQ